MLKEYQSNGTLGMILKVRAFNILWSLAGQRSEYALILDIHSCWHNIRRISLNGFDPSDQSQPNVRYAFVSDEQTFN
jgi:hypothetical protein